MRGDRIRKLREELGWTQEMLCERLELPILAMNRYENNKTAPDANKLARIAEALGCSTDYLTGLTDDPTPRRLGTAELKAKERVALSAWRRGDRIDAIKVIVEDE
jgi:transcriptional regulator with XRE-family HTH domain